jgi:hypothetical protein
MTGDTLFRFTSDKIHLTEFSFSGKDNNKRFAAIYNGKGKGCEN